MKTAFITGITGQDGSYLAELLLAKGYRVTGLVRDLEKSSNHHLGRDVEFFQGNLDDAESLARIVVQLRPDEVYNLAAQTFPQGSIGHTVATGDLNGLGVARLLAQIHRHVPHARFFQAGTSELFGMVLQSPQNESTPFHPRNPYGIAKAYAHYLVQYYREQHGLFACNGILFNHESPRRGQEFVTRKITFGAARIYHGLLDTLHLGNLDAQRDWTHARDVVQSMWQMLQMDTPRDFVVGSGTLHSVREFVELAFSCVGLDWQRHVAVDPKLVRQNEQFPLVADTRNIQRQLGWRPTTSFPQLVTEMVEADLHLTKPGAGASPSNHKVA